MIDYLKIFLLVFKILPWLRVVWVIIKFAFKIHNAFFDKEPISSATKTNILKQALEAVDEGDVLKLNNSLQYFNSVSKH